MEETITILRSDRKTISLRIYDDGKIVVRAPRRMPDADIREFIHRKEHWIQTHLEEIKKRQATKQDLPRLTLTEVQALAEQALRIIPERVAHYAPLVGVTYGRITIRNQKTRWGSCSAKGNLNFNCLLMLTPPEVVDSVVVHELCHRKVMNHSKEFYDEVLRVYPEYRKWHGWLREHGAELMARMYP